MPQPPSTTRLDELIRQKAQIEAQISTLTARQVTQRKKDTDRLKWLLGSLVFDRMATDTALRAWVQRELQGQLTKRDLDRGLWEVLFPKETDAKP